MTDLEINKALALAIGYLPEHVRIRRSIVLKEQGGNEFAQIVQVYRVFLTMHPEPLPLWKIFDYRNPAVIWPIAERYNCFPAREFHKGRLTDRWWAFGKDMHFHYADTAAKAVALAVIGGAK